MPPWPRRGERAGPCADPSARRRCALGPRQAEGVVGADRPGSWNPIRIAMFHKHDPSVYPHEDPQWSFKLAILVHLCSPLSQGWFSCSNRSVGKPWGTLETYGDGSIPINTIFRGMNIHLPAILMFTRGTRFWHTAISKFPQFPFKHPTSLAPRWHRMHPLKKPQTHSPCWFLSQTQANDHLRIGIARVEMHPKCLFPAAVYQCTGWQMTNHEPYVFLVWWTVLSFCFKCWNPTKTNAYHILSWFSVLKCHWKYHIIILYQCHVIGKVVLISSFYCQCLSYPIHDWLVVSTPLKSISQLGSLFPIYGKSKKSCSKPPTRSPSYSHCCWFIAYNHY